MDISSVSSGSYNRAVTPTKSGSDRHANAETQATNGQNNSRELAESRQMERAQQQRELERNQEQRRNESQRRLDGRIVSYGPPGGEVDQQQLQQKYADYTREKVKDAYTPSKNELTRSHSTHNQHSETRQSEAIDIVV